MKDFKIEYKNGRWLVDGKRLQDLNHDQKNALNDFFTEMKLLFEEEHQELHNAAMGALKELVKVHNDQLNVSHTEIVNSEASVYAFEQAEKVIKQSKHRS